MSLRGEQRCRPSLRVSSTRQRRLPLLYSTSVTSRKGLAFRIIFISASLILKYKTYLCPLNSQGRYTLMAVTDRGIGLHTWRLKTRYAPERQKPTPAATTTAVATPISNARYRLLLCVTSCSQRLDERGRSSYKTTESDRPSSVAGANQEDDAHDDGQDQEDPPQRDNHILRSPQRIGLVALEPDQEVRPPHAHEADNERQAV